MDNNTGAGGCVCPPFSVLIPSWNNLPYLRLCVDSLLRHSAAEHQIIIHVNDGSDGTLQWVRDRGYDYTWTPHNVGVCLAMNAMRPKVRHDYMVFFNDDMYALPRWDTALWAEIAPLGHNRFFFSATTIQPRTASGPVILRDFGSTPETFREQELLDSYTSFGKSDWSGATLPPNIVHRDMWDLAGGYSVELSPGMYSDPDFTAKLWLCGVRLMKGVSASRIYHFETKSTGRVRRNPGRRQFLLKWGMTSSTFRRLLTHRDRDYDPAATGRFDASAMKRGLVKSRLEAINAVTRHPFGPLWKLYRPNAAEPESPEPNKK